MLLGAGSCPSHGDGVGSVVAWTLADSDWIAIDCCTVLENAAGIVSHERPSLLVILDVAHMNTAPRTFL